jgi:hypothetical protein
MDYELGKCAAFPELLKLMNIEHDTGNSRSVSIVQIVSLPAASLRSLRCGNVTLGVEDFTLGSSSSLQDGISERQYFKGRQIGEKSEPFLNWNGVYTFDAGNSELCQILQDRPREAEGAPIQIECSEAWGLAVEERLREQVML